jgi:hypothetical protein
LAKEKEVALESLKTKMENKEKLNKLILSKLAQEKCVKELELNKSKADQIDKLNKQFNKQIENLNAELAVKNSQLVEQISQFNYQQGILQLKEKNFLEVKEMLSESLKKMESEITSKSGTVIYK